jgi:hypothetical protein
MLRIPRYSARPLHCNIRCLVAMFGTDGVEIGVFLPLALCKRGLATAVQAACANGSAMERITITVTV